MRYVARAPLRIDFGGGWTDVPIYAMAEGGAVLNAAITRYVRGRISSPDHTGWLHAVRGDRSYLEYSLDVPSGAGLGASAAQTVLWATLVRTTIANVADRREIAETACGIAGALGLQGGKQDEYASALGGIHLFTFDDRVTAERLELPKESSAELAERLVLVYSGTRRLSSSIHEYVWTRYRERDHVVLQALAGLRRLASEMRDALMVRDFTAFGDLLNENWEFQKSLHPSVTNAGLDDLMTYARQHGAMGGKACGAGGGGCVVFLATPDEAGRLERALARQGFEVIDFDFDTQGVYLTRG